MVSPRLSTYHDLIDAIDVLLQATIQSKKAVRKTYEQLFLDNLSISPFQLALPELHHALNQPLDLDSANLYSCMIFRLALEAGFSPCSGVALGFDRLLMIRAKTKKN